MSDLTPQPQITAVGVCPHDGHMLVEVEGETMHLIPGTEVHAWKRAEKYITDGHGWQPVAEAEHLLRKAANG